MKPVEPSELLNLAEYEKIRPHFRGRVIDEKKRRRISVGPHLTVLFENHDTVLLQVQEMLRTERITRDAAVLHEVETYNQLLGGENELGATMMIEIPDPAERDAFLVKAKGIESHVALLVDGKAVRATFDPARVLSDRASAVVYLKFPLGPELARRVRSKEARLSVSIDHPAVQASGEIAPLVVQSLAEDLRRVSGEVFVFERQVRFDEVDAAQILFFGRFFGYCHEAMEAFFGQVPGGYVELVKTRRIGLPAVHVESDFESPLRFGDVVRIEVTVDRVGKSSTAFRHTMIRKHDGVRAAVIVHVCAAVDLSTMKSLPLPDDLRGLLERHRTVAPA